MPSSSHIPIVPGSWPPKLGGSLQRYDIFWIFGIVAAGIVAGAVAMVLWKSVTVPLTRHWSSLCLYLPQMDQAEILAEIAMGSLVIGWGGWLLARDRGIDVRAFGLRTFPGRWLLAAVILFALFFWVDEILSGWVDPTGELQEELIADLFQLRQSLFWAVMVAVTIGPIAAVSEEILFRGLLYRWFRERMGIAMAALLSAAIFAIAHFYFLAPGEFAGLITTLGVFVFGLVAALLYQISSSLWPSILFQAFNNVAVVYAVYLPPAG